MPSHGGLPEEAAALIEPSLALRAFDVPAHQTAR